MAIKELILHGVTSIEPKLISSSDVSNQWNTRIIRFEMDDGTSFTIVAFADHKEDLKLNIEIPKALQGEN